MPTIIDSFMVVLGMNTEGVKEAVRHTEADMAKLKIAATEAQQALNQAIKMNLGPSAEPEIQRLSAAASTAKKAYADAQAAARKALKETNDEAKRVAQEMSEQGAKGAEFFHKMAEAAVGFFTIIAGGHELKELMRSVQEEEVAMLRLSDAMGMDIVTLNEWSGAAVLAGGSATGFQSSIKGLSGNLVDIEKNLPRAKRAMMVLKAAGIEGLALGKKTELSSVLDQLADKMQKMGGMEAIRLGSRMGLDEATIRLFRMGSEEMANLRKEAGQLDDITAEEAKSSHELEVSQIKLKMATGDLAEIVVHMLQPALTKFNELLKDIVIWAKSNPEMVKKGFMIMAGAITAVGIAGAVAAIEMAPITLTLLAAAAAGAALGLILYKITEGWDQVGADGVSTWERVKNATIDVMGTIWGLTDNAMNKVIDAFGIMEGAFDGDTKKMSQSWHFLMEDMGQDVKNTKSLAGGFWGWLVGRMTALWNFAEAHPFASIMLPTTMIHHIVKGWMWVFDFITNSWAKFKMSAGLAIDYIVEKLANLANAIAKVAQTLGIPMAATLVATTSAAQATAHANTVNDVQQYTYRSDPDKYLAERNARILANHPQQNIPRPISASLAMMPSYNHSTRSSQVTKETHIGTIQINAPGVTDAKGVAAELPGAIQATFSVDDADDGMVD